MVIFQGCQRARACDALTAPEPKLVFNCLRSLCTRNIMLPSGNALQVLNAHIMEEIKYTKQYITTYTR